MNTYFTLLNNLVIYGTIILEVGLLILIILFVGLKIGGDEFKKSLVQFLGMIIGWQHKVLKSFGLDFKYGLENLEKIIIIKTFFLGLIGSISTLIYSEVFGVVPCALCWFERVFMYGITIITGVALFARNRLEEVGILRYIFVFSLFGAGVSLYHHILQMTATANSHLPCPTSGGDCAKLLIFEFGHITYPWTAFVSFSLFIFGILIYKEISRNLK